jgi:glucokinase
LAVIAVDLQSTRFTCAAVSKSGIILEKETVELTNVSGSDVSKLMQQRMNKIILNFMDKPIQIRSVGIGVPGIYFSRTGEVWAPNIPGWQNYNLKKDMNNFLADYKLIAKIASKRTCDILGERWLGAARKSRNAIFISIGAGIGAGILMDGKILHGYNDGAGATGWMAVNPEYKEEYRNKGCLEFLASSKGLMDLICKTIQSKENYKGILRKEGELTIVDLFKAYEMKDAIAHQVLKTAVEYWAVAAANLINLFNPEILIFGGAIFGPAIKFIPEIRNEAEKWIQPLFFNQVKFLHSQLGENAGLLGAGHLALKKI